MTHHESLLYDALLPEVRGLDTEQALRLLLERGLLNRTACERLAVRREMARLADRHVPRCEALLIVAERLCCSYEKARGLYYAK